MEAASATAANSNVRSHVVVELPFQAAAMQQREEAAREFAHWSDLTHNAAPRPGGCAARGAPGRSKRSAPRAANSVRSHVVIEPPFQAAAMRQREEAAREFAHWSHLTHNAPPRPGGCAAHGAPGAIEAASATAANSFRRHVVIEPPFQVAAMQQREEAAREFAHGQTSFIAQRRGRVDAQRTVHRGRRKRPAPRRRTASADMSSSSCHFRPRRWSNAKKRRENLRMVRPHS